MRIGITIGKEAGRKDMLIRKEASVADASAIFLNQKS
jgi:hypothetical protein